MNIHDRLTALERSHALTRTLAVTTTRYLDASGTYGGMKDALKAVEDEGRAEARGLCGERNGDFVCNLAAGHDGCHEDRNPSGGCVGWAPAAPMRPDAPGEAERESFRIKVIAYGAAICPPSLDTVKQRLADVMAAYDALRAQARPLPTEEQAMDALDRFEQAAVTLDRIRTAIGVSEDDSPIAQIHLKDCNAIHVAARTAVLRLLRGET